MRWGLLSTRNGATVLKAEAIRQEYVVSRLEAMRNKPNRLLGRVEIEDFGYEVDPPDIDDTEDDGGDDD